MSQSNSIKDRDVVSMYGSAGMKELRHRHRGTSQYEAGWSR